MSTSRQTLAEESWLTRRQDRYGLQAGNTNRRHQLQGSEDSIGCQQGAEDAEWPSLAQIEGTRQPWMATSLEEGQLQTETRLRQGLHQTCLREGKPKEKPGLRASPHEPCHRRQRTVARVACATHKTSCSCIYDTMAMQLSLEWCGVVLLDRIQGGTAPGSQPQRSPTSATDCDSDPSGNYNISWNSSSHRIFIRGYEVFQQDRENRTKWGLLTLLRNNIPAAEIQRSGQADLDTEYLGVKLVLAGTPMTVSNIYSPPDKQIQLHNIKVEPQSWTITGDFNSHSPCWGYEQLNNKGEKVEHWITENRLILINKPDDPDTFYSRTWRTTSTPDLAIATDDIQGTAEQEVSSQLGGSDHRPVIISIKGQTRPHRNKLPASWNYKKVDWDAFREAVDRKSAALELPETNTSSSVALFNKAVLEAAKDVKAPWLSALLHSRAWQLAQGLTPSKREDGKLANKCKCRGTQ